MVKHIATENRNLNGQTKYSLAIGRVRLFQNIPRE